MFKRTITLILALIMALGLLPMTASAETDGIAVIVNGRKLSFEIPPAIVNGRVIVPADALFKAIGASFNWNAEEQTINAVRGGVTLTVHTGDGAVYVGGAAANLDVPAQISGGKAFVPLRAVCEVFGFTVNWDGFSKTAVIWKNIPVPENGGAAGTYNNTGALTQGIFRIIDSGDYHIYAVMATGGSNEDMSFDFSMDYHYFAKNGMIALIIDFFVVQRTVFRDGMTYKMYDDYQVMSIEDGTEESDFLLAATSDQLTFIREGSENFLGEECRYDEFVHYEGFNIKYFVDGDGAFLGTLTTDPDGSVSITAVMVFEDSAPSEVFEIPTDYEIEE